MASESLDELGARAQVAARALRVATSQTKREALLAAASGLKSSADQVLAANAADVAAALSEGLTPTAVDRLRLSVERVSQMAEAMRTVAALADPVGEIVEGRVLANGLQIRRVRVPLGVIGIVYENRPNVTADAAALCLRSGNAVMLRGSAGALQSNRAISAVIREAIAQVGLPEDAVQLVEDVRHETVAEFAKMRGVIDCLIPRGGHSLVQLIIDEATVPYVIDGDGNCHVFVDESADLDMAERIIVNAKLQRPSVCNAMETLLVHEAIAPIALPRFASALEGVELVGDEQTMAIVPGVGKASEEDYATEFLALKLAVGVVKDIDAAIAHISRFSSGHSEAIVTNNRNHARRFVEEVDAAAVLVNASTRFVDGGELGLGAEIGISTQKLHARGPMGLRELTTEKYVIEGDGQVRA
jgi:glutamate-5-semialdehyde dehydrogenase